MPSVRALEKLSALLQKGRMKYAPLTLSSLVPLMLAAAPAPNQSVPSQRAAPAASPGSWFSDADYPAAAMRMEQDGITAFQLDVDKTGTPTRCTITSSSGVALLDQTTCDKLMERARFTPARNASNKAVADTYAGRMAWRLPEADGTMSLPPLPYVQVVTFMVNLDGSVSDCVAMLNGKPAQPQICADIVSSRRYPVQRDATGKPMRQKLRMTMGFEKVD
ncbi:MAG: energy transducer TonB [bacterium]|nr:energy transducer TonB [bacterium]